MTEDRRYFKAESGGPPGPLQSAAPTGTVSFSLKDGRRIPATLSVIDPTHWRAIATEKIDEDDLASITSDVPAGVQIEFVFDGS